MKIVSDIPSKEEAAIIAEIPKEHTMVARVCLKGGQKLWVYNPADNSLTEVVRNQTVLEPARYKEGRPEIIHSKATFDAKKLYCIAINRTNAAKKIAIQIKSAIR